MMTIDEAERLAAQYEAKAAEFDAWADESDIEVAWLGDDGVGGRDAADAMNADFEKQVAVYRHAAFRLRQGAADLRARALADASAMLAASCPADVFETLH